MDESPDSHSSTHRLEAFSDGVFAIAITLLIIEIGVPEVEEGHSLQDALWDLWPSYGAYVLSFVTIGIYWVNHHSFFEYFRRTDHYFLLINVFFLMAVAFLPFPTAVLGDYMTDDEHRQAAVTLYAIGLLLPAAFWMSMWLYAQRAGLVISGLQPRFVRQLTWQYIASSGVYVIAIVASMVNAWAALVFCTGITALYLLPPRRPRFIGNHEPIQRDHEHRDDD